MPHINVKLWPGPTEEQKTQLAQAITENVMQYTGCGNHSVSVAIEEVSPEDWEKKVYTPEIQAGKGTLYKDPGYTM